MIESDKELLELAAKAAGVYPATFQGISCGYVRHDGIIGSWNPLTDDGDAQRLRNKLRMDVFYTDQGVNVAHDDVLLAFEPWGTKDLATERRAITRAAAQMQLNKEKP